MCSRRSVFRSSTETCARIPAAMRAALVPAIPAPSTTTLAARTPVAPPKSFPLPPFIRSRKYAPE